MYQLAAMLRHEVAAGLPRLGSIACHARPARRSVHAVAAPVRPRPATRKVTNPLEPPVPDAIKLKGRHGPQVAQQAPAPQKQGQNQQQQAPVASKVDMSSLNDSQLQATQFKGGPCRVVAGPGSGKTRVCLPAPFCLGSFVSKRNLKGVDQASTQLAEAH